MAKSPMFNLLVKDGEILIREWIDKKGKAYKYEIRTPNYQGYLDPYIKSKK